MSYLLDTRTLLELLRASPPNALVRRIAQVPTADRWTSVISVSQMLLAARREQDPRLMQDVVRLELELFRAEERARDFFALAPRLPLVEGTRVFEVAGRLRAVFLAGRFLRPLAISWIHSSVFSRASESVNWTGGDFLK